MLINRDGICHFCIHLPHWHWPLVTQATSCHQLTLVPWGPRESKDYEEIERYAALRCRNPLMVWAESGDVVGTYWSIPNTWSRMACCNVACCNQYKLQCQPLPKAQSKDTVFSPSMPLPGMGSVNPWGTECHDLLVNSSWMAMTAPLKHVVRNAWNVQSVWCRRCFRFLVMTVALVSLTCT